VDLKKCGFVPTFSLDQKLNEMKDNVGAKQM